MLKNRVVELVYFISEIVQIPNNIIESCLLYIYLYFRTFIKYNIMVIYRVDYEQKKNNTKIK